MIVHASFVWILDGESKYDGLKVSTCLTFPPIGKPWLSSDSPMNISASPALAICWVLCKFAANVKCLSHGDAASMQSTGYQKYNCVEMYRVALLQIGAVVTHQGTRSLHLFLAKQLIGLLGWLAWIIGQTSELQVFEIVERFHCETETNSRRKNAFAL